MQFLIFRTLKMVIGFVLAILIAEVFSLNYATSAGIIVLLSIQATKRESFKSARIRILAFILAFIIAPIIFYLLGFSIYSFGFFLLIFIPIALFYGFQEGIVVNSVLVTHLLLEKSLAFPVILNEIWLMLIGVATALLLNLYIPNNEKQLRRDKERIETIMSEILFLMAQSLRDQTVSVREEMLYSKLRGVLKIAKDNAYKNSNYYYSIQEDYYVAYVNMRYQQFYQLKRMREHFKRLYLTYSVTLFVAEFTEKLANSISVMNAKQLLEDLIKLRDDFKEIQLPKTRDEFENRAMLYQFLNDLEQFLEIKKDYYLKYKHEKINRFIKD